jgi:hypothetical protein
LTCIDTKGREGENGEKRKASSIGFGYQRDRSEAGDKNGQTDPLDGRIQVERSFVESTL